MLVDLRPWDAELTGKQAQEALDQAGITLNRNTIPDDPRPPFVTSGLRLGTAAVTTAGMREGEMGEIADLMVAALKSAGDDKGLADVRAAVVQLCGRFTPYPELQA
jgi:glycine hydroxymethyltransferase